MTEALRRDVDVGGRRIETALWPGDEARAAVVLLHEGLGSIDLWRGFPAAIARATRRRVVAFSRFGHGRSEPPPQPRTPAFFHSEALDVLPAVLDALALREPILVGHSDGASIALIHASEHDVGGLVLLAPHVFVEPLTVEAIRATRTEYEAGGLRARMQRHHDDVDAAFWGWCGVWLDPAFLDWDLRPEAARVTAPTMLVQGVEDAYGTLAQLDRIAGAVRGPVTRVELPGGHSPHLDQPELALEAVAAFTDRMR